ncbi:tetratricopeptide repeat protein [Hymenobacter negativus]|uniref:Tetratricopeptide repeat protein n=1 Tax=Hymenobacter negativus TaxID=2795026 RepID=A0ABS3QAA1_9BACT|nr:tetratricopeptide repeat protein [Hymenobacter negativus]MBO2008171.1 tetratricopeptide repeat protein [Hymenobacter negativus]
MKKLLFLLWSASIGVAAAQTSGNPAQRDLVEQGVRLYDDGKYDEAVTKYQQALATDPADEVANSELALTYNALHRYAEAAAVCEKLLKTNPEIAGSVYVTYGNSLDGQKKVKQALQAYDDGLRHHPNYYALYYNKGIAQAGSGEAAGAISSFQQSVLRNPNHASSHMSLGLVQSRTDARIPSILALARFLVLEPGSQRATQRLPVLDKEMMAGVTQTGEQAITISLSEKAVKDAGRKREIPDNFGQAELVLAAAGAQNLGEDGQAVSSMERFSKQLTVLCEDLAELSAKKPTGFTWGYYVPYFVELEKKGYVPALTYLIHSSQTDAPEVQQWLVAHPNEVAVFREWSKNYLWPKPLK